MSRWETSAQLEAEVAPAAVWSRAYADAGAWPSWNSEIEAPSSTGRWRWARRRGSSSSTGLRLRFRVVEFEPGRLFTDESRLPGARMGHRHLVEPTEAAAA